jgi:hypothetical protein
MIFAAYFDVLNWVCLFSMILKPHRWVTENLKFCKELKFLPKWSKINKIINIGFHNSINIYLVFDPKVYFLYIKDILNWLKKNCKIGQKMAIFLQSVQNIFSVNIMFVRFFLRKERYFEFEKEQTKGPFQYDVISISTILLPLPTQVIMSSLNW